MAQYGEWRSALVIFLRCELASHLRKNAQHAEKSSAYALLLNVLNVACGGEIDAGSAVGINRRVQKCRVIPHQLPRPAVLSDIIALSALGSEVRYHTGQAVRLRKRQGPK